MRSPVAAAFAIAFGLVVLLGYIIPAGTGVPALDNLLQLRTQIVSWAVTIAGFATLVAILGLVDTHWRKLRARRSPDRYSFFMLAGFFLTVVFGVFAYLTGRVADFQVVVTAIQAPVEASLMALLAVTLALASLRLFQRRRGLLPIVFVISVLVYLLLNSGLLASQENIPFIGDILAMLQFLPIAGARGILLGIALGSIMVGLRILFSTDRPYSG